MNGESREQPQEDPYGFQNWLRQVKEEPFPGAHDVKNEEHQRMQVDNHVSSIEMTASTALKYKNAGEEEVVQFIKEALDVTKDSLVAAGADETIVHNSLVKSTTGDQVSEILSNTAREHFGLPPKEN